MSARTDPDCSCQWVTRDFVGRVLRVTNRIIYRRTHGISSSNDIDGIRPDRRHPLLGDEVVATLQLTVIPGLARGGALRAQIEAVRVDARWRSRGLGGALIRWAIAEAERRGCALVQLTADATRTDAHRFYTRLGFVDSHVGYKMALGTTG